MMNRLSIYLRQEIAKIDFSLFMSTMILKRGVSIYLWWSIPACLFVLFSSRYHTSLPSGYFSHAIDESAAPHLWNVLGTLGLMLLGLSCVFPRFRFTTDGAHHILTNTLPIAGLTIGVKLGTFFFSCLYGNATTTMLQAGILGVLVIAVISLNLILWQLGNLTAPNKTSNSFLSSLEQVKLPLRLFAFFLMAVVPVLWFIHAT